ncbi:hypothetical protein [Natrarchaeobius oligotrophus]|uniref:Small CPxCG-related zinc finger protein n=1 Tax=Natrarchaeobius chitinivorans TaxID=1679083 RepID=A0A3N6MT40_NATCH|nr:hypothetical protein [Natrarchaeobius chitinivorans]RQH01011.1 hypothetical protein EA472_09535 [Natrarchaeobius chitinivorans]
MSGEPASDAESPSDSRRTSDSSPSTDCPHCGRPVARVSVVGPLEAVAGPCGCRVAPDLLMD